MSRPDDTRREPYSNLGIGGRNAAAVMEGERGLEARVTSNARRAAPCRNAEAAMEGEHGLEARVTSNARQGGSLPERGGDDGRRARAGSPCHLECAAGHNGRLLAGTRRRRWKASTGWKPVSPQMHGSAAVPPLECAAGRRCHPSNARRRGGVTSNARRRHRSVALFAQQKVHGRQARHSPGGRGFQDSECWRCLFQPNLALRASSCCFISTGRRSPNLAKCSSICGTTAFQPCTSTSSRCSRSAAVIFRPLMSREPWAGR